MEYYDDAEDFANQLSKKTRFEEDWLQFVYDKFFDMNPITRLRFWTKDWVNWLKNECLMENNMKLTKQYLRKLIKEEYEQMQIDYDNQSELNDLFDKLVKIYGPGWKPGERRKLDGRWCKIYSGGPILWYKDAKTGEIVAAATDEDRPHDDLRRAEEKGFGPNLFGRLKRLSKKEETRGYSTFYFF